jgi:hypothetical protein
MTELTRYRAAAWFGPGLLTLVLCGCSAANRSEFDILPNTDKARDALEKALTAWQNGQKVGKVQESSPGIEAIDNVWQAGKKLTSFEVLQAVDKPGPRWFLVKLTLKDAQPQQVHYAVLGLDPLWVYREEDYNQACGMGK